MEIKQEDKDRYDKIKDLMYKGVGRNVYVVAHWYAILMAEHKDIWNAETDADRVRALEKYNVSLNILKAAIKDLNYVTNNKGE